MSRTLALLVPGVLLAACGGDSGDSTSSARLYPVAEVSAERLEFDEVAWGDSLTRRVYLRNAGDYPMGVGSIALGEGEMEENFALSVDFDLVECPDDGGDSAGDSGSTTARISVVAPPPASDTGDYYADGGATDSGHSGLGSGSRVLGPGCSLPIDVTLTPSRVGEIVGSIRIETVDEVISDGSDAEQTYWADPDNSYLVVLLDGQGTKGAPNIFVSPRAVNFGTVWEGESKSSLIDVWNTGEGDLLLDAPYLDDSCDPGFAIDWSYDQDFVLAGGSLTGIEATFTPTSDDAAECILWVKSDDPDEPFIDIPMEGNVGNDPTECDPEVRIITPSVGYQHLTGDDVPLSFKVFDCNEPATNLTVSVRSGVLKTDDPILIENFHPPDESGYVQTTIPRKLLAAGTDTIIVRVQDSAGNRTDATTTVLYRATYPPSDDDGDGFGEVESEGSIDCDDANPYTYPQAAERYDSADNDCDGVVDEGTEGYDDDGDGYSEADGDCDDKDDASHPGAPEEPDYRDNNCDGRIDENTTLSDDDGDGFAESEGDCDDGDADINPRATEYCDGIDNDCNGISDERDGCVDLVTDPILVGGIRASRTAIGLGETVDLTAWAFDADGDPITYAWQQDPVLTNRGFVAIDQPGSVSPTFTAPSSFPERRTESETYTITLRISDPNMGVDFDDVEITVYAEPVALTDAPASATGDNGAGCGKNSAAAVVLPGLLSLLALTGRRRRQD
ncbi:MAG: choice-of-anchor D domain-containing protein [Deltaproteobacteria bacterium]|nr:MAG: choice-of-anchor D domain-containing protein [Deltaproteobacteria bacterium]